MERVEAQKKQTLLVHNDSIKKAAKSKKCLALVLASRHGNIHLVVLRHNLFQTTKSSETIDLNVTQNILFNSPRDSEQVGILECQKGE